MENFPNPDTSAAKLKCMQAVGLGHEISACSRSHFEILILAAKHIILCSSCPFRL